jgi:hypothetical protein
MEEVDPQRNASKPPSPIFDRPSSAFAVRSRGHGRARPYGTPRFPSAPTRTSYQPAAARRSMMCRPDQRLADQSNRTIVRRSTVPLKSSPLKNSCGPDENDKTTSSRSGSPVRRTLSRASIVSTPLDDVPDRLLPRVLRCNSVADTTVPALTCDELTSTRLSSDELSFLGIHVGNKNGDTGKFGDVPLIFKLKELSGALISSTIRLRKKLQCMPGGLLARTKTAPAMLERWNVETEAVNGQSVRPEPVHGSGNAVSQEVCLLDQDDQPLVNITRIVGLRQPARHIRVTRRRIAAGTTAIKVDMIGRYLMSCQDVIPDPSGPTRDSRTTTS